MDKIDLFSDIYPEEDYRSILTRKNMRSKIWVSLKEMLIVRNYYQY